jgi:hypothetical protein
MQKTENRNEEERRGTGQPLMLMQLACLGLVPCISRASTEVNGQMELA